jgi:transcriptional regulator with XRE-family HTH domain
MDRITPTLAERISARRKELGLRQEDLARAAGVSVAAVSQWEKGQTKNLRLEHLFAICDKLRVHPRWLALGQGAKYIALVLAALFVVPPSPAEAYVGRLCIMLNHARSWVLRHIWPHLATV